MCFDHPVQYRHERGGEVEITGGRDMVWFPVNYLLIEAIGWFARFFGGDFVVEYPSGSG